MTGPTASGKTAVGLSLAARLPGEIISLDSMALYRRLDIGTAKPTQDERRRVPHHLIDILDPHQEYSLAQYLTAAHRAAGEIAGRGLTPLFVGGTPLYLKGLLRGIFEGPAADWPYREKLQAQAAVEAPGWLHQQLSRVDPAAAAKLHPQDQRRLIRALEVFRNTGRPISAWQQQFDRPHTAGECRAFVLEWPRDELYARIERRVDAMFQEGLLDEVRGLVAASQHSAAPLGRTAAQALGYREVLAHLAGERDLPATIALVKTRTRQFAKRQLTWFRSLPECRPVPVRASDNADEIAERVLKMTSDE
ncbi:MAG: tRNA (adenosine(37)-N6)-dimethylallyltransferase MiaA [Pirellulales bacterium]